MERRFEGYTGDLVLTDTGVRITRGFKSAFRQLVVRGDKFLQFSSIKFRSALGAPLDTFSSVSAEAVRLRPGCSSLTVTRTAYGGTGGAGAGVPSSRRHANSFWPESRPKWRRRRSVLTALKR